MDLFLKILGGLALVVILLILLAGAWIVWKWKVLKAAFQNSGGTPPEVHLRPAESSEWTREPAVERMINDFVAVGFERGECYDIDPMPGLSVQSLYDPSSRLRACIYLHPTAGSFVDICANFVDGKELTVSNAPQGSEIATRPDTQKIFLKNSTVSQLVERTRAEIEGHELLESAADQFPTEFELAYRKDMAWHNVRGGITEEELRRIAANSGMSFSETVIQQSFIQTKHEELQRWEEECLEHFAEQSDIPVSQWKRFEDQTFIFRSDFHPVGYVRYLADKFEWESEVTESFEAEAAQPEINLDDLMRRICEVARAEITELGVATTPTQAVIYGYEVTADA